MQILRPFEIADGDAAGIGENVRQHENAFARQNFVGMRRRRPIGAFGNDLGLDLVGVVQRDDVFQRRRNQDVALQRQQILIGDARRARHAHDGAGALLVAQRFERIDAARIVHAAARIADGHDLAPSSPQRARAAAAPTLP